MLGLRLHRVALLSWPLPPSSIFSSPFSGSRSVSTSLILFPSLHPPLLLTSCSLLSISLILSLFCPLSRSVFSLLPFLSSPHCLSVSPLHLTPFPSLIFYPLSPCPSHLCPCSSPAIPHWSHPGAGCQLRTGRDSVTKVQEDLVEEQGYALGSEGLPTCLRSLA